MKSIAQNKLILFFSFCDIYITTPSNAEDNIYSVTIFLQLATSRATFLSFVICGNAPKNNYRNFPNGVQNQHRELIGTTQSNYQNIH